MCYRRERVEVDVRPLRSLRGLHKKTKRSENTVRLCEDSSVQNCARVGFARARGAGERGCLAARRPPLCKKGRFSTAVGVENTTGDAKAACDAASCADSASDADAANDAEAIHSAVAQVTHGRSRRFCPGGPDDQEEVQEPVLVPRITSLIGPQGSQEFCKKPPTPLQ